VTDVSIVIPYFEAPEALKATLAGVAAQTFAAAECIVVDDGSRSELVPVVDGSRVRVLRQEDQGFGLARARNLGARHASGGLLVFLDCDMIPDPNWLAAHVETFESGADVVSLGFRTHFDIDKFDLSSIEEAVQRDDLGDLFATGRTEVPDWIEFHLHRTEGLSYRYDDAFRVVTGGNLAVGRSLFEEVGGFDESFTQWGGEDTELGYRLWIAGAELSPTREAHCWHQGLGIRPDEAEARSQREQRAKLANLIAHRDFRDHQRGRSYAVPMIRARVDCGEASEADIFETVESLLASEMDDLTIELDLGEHPSERFLRNTYGGDRRVLVDRVDNAISSTPLIMTVPAGTLFSAESLAQLERRIGPVGLLDVVATNGRPVSLVKARAMNRASRLAVQDPDGWTRSELGSVEVDARTVGIALVSSARAVARRRPSAPPSRLFRVARRLRRVRSFRDARDVARWLRAAVLTRLGRTASSMPRPAGRVPISSPSIAVIGDLPWNGGTAARIDHSRRIDLVVVAGEVADDCDVRRLAELGVPTLAVDVEELGASWLVAPVSTPVSDQAWSDPRAIGPGDSAKTILAAVMRGEPVYGTPARDVSDRFGGELRALIPPTRPPEPEIELLGLRQRRAALRAHSLDERINRLLEMAGRPRNHDSVSVVLASNRPDRLPAAIRSVSAQRYGNLELLVGTHGQGPTKETSLAVEMCMFPTRIVEFEQDAVFGDVLEKLSVRADGRLLAKFDDDDFYGSDHLFDLVVGWRATRSQMVGKAAEFVYLQDEDLTIRRVPGGLQRDSTWLAGGAMIVTVEAFREAGGWRPLHRHVDQALIKDLRSVGGTTYRLPGFAYMLHRHGAHTWSKGSSSFVLEAESRWDGWRGDLADVERYS
jgi:GT2 family glycosyltransferase